MPSRMTIGNPVLRIRDIDRILTFYEKTVGLQVIKRYSAYDYDDNSDDLIYEIGLKSKFKPTTSHITSRSER
jgi:catechol 2,3-dioxygenase-like lactoylglutathione lyase family enzyme